MFGIAIAAASCPSLGLPHKCDPDLDGSRLSPQLLNDKGKGLRVDTILTQPDTQC